MSQSWPLSQLINKSSGTCRVCLATRQIHIRDGTIHKHGPRHDPCPGSNKLPLQASSQLSAPAGEPISSSHSSLANPAPSSSSANRVLPADVSASQSKAQAPIWSPVGSTVIKRIPKSARHACASHLATLLRKVVSNPESSPNWQDLFNWSQIILSAPKVGSATTLLQQLNVGFPPIRLVSPSRPPLTQHLLSTDRQTQLQLSVKRCQQNRKMEMSGQHCVFSCRMTVPSSLHYSLSTPCWRNILPLLPLLLICQLLIRSSAYLWRNPRFVRLFFFISYWLSGRSRRPAPSTYS